MPDPIYLKNHIYVTICVWRSKNCCFYILDLLPRTIKCCVSFKLGKNSAPAVSETFVIFLYLSFFLWQLFGNCSLFLYETKNGRERGIPAFFLQYLAWIQFWLQRLLEERKQTYSSRKVSLFVCSKAFRRECYWEQSHGNQSPSLLYYHRDILTSFWVTFF